MVGTPLIQPAESQCASATDPLPTSVAICVYRNSDYTTADAPDVPTTTNMEIATDMTAGVSSTLAASLVLRW